MPEDNREVGSGCAFNDAKMAGADYATCFKNETEIDLASIKLAYGPASKIYLNRSAGHAGEDTVFGLSFNPACGRAL